MVQSAKYRPVVFQNYHSSLSDLCIYSHNEQVLFSSNFMAFYRSTCGINHIG